MSDQDFQTPQPASIDFDPPAYSQPTLPPPGDDDDVVTAPSGAAGSGAARWGARVLGAGLVAVVAASIGAYAFLPHAPPEMAVAKISAPVSVTAQLTKLAEAFPSQVADSACTDSAERTPLVLLSEIDGLKSGSSPAALEKDLFSGASPVTGPTMLLRGQRVALLKTVENHDAEASAREPRPGRYQGVLVVFDAASGKQLCQTTIEATSTTDLRWANVSPSAMHHDYLTRVRNSLTEAANRLHVDVTF